MKLNEDLPVNVEHSRLRELADRLGQLHSNDRQILWLAQALYRIGSGEDANAVLLVKRPRGYDDKKANSHYAIQIAIHWIAGEMNPLDGSKPTLKEEAISKAALFFALDHDNLKRQCPSIKRLKEIAKFNWDDQRPRMHKPQD